MVLLSFSFSHFLFKLFIAVLLFFALIGFFSVIGVYIKIIYDVARGKDDLGSGDFPTWWGG